MISLENKEFLKKRFNINSDDYTEEELDKKLDEIIIKLNKEIMEKEIAKKMLVSQIVNLELEKES